MIRRLRALALLVVACLVIRNLSFLWHGRVQSMNEVMDGSPTPATNTTYKLKADQQEANSTLHDFAITPTFETFHDFRLGPRPHPLKTGKSLSELKKNMSDIIDDDRPFAGFYTVPGHLYYAAAWLSNTQTLLQNPYITEDFLQTGNPNMEYGFFAAWKGVRQSAVTMDMFDFMVHHLSNFRKVAKGKFKTLDEDVLRLCATMEAGYRKRGYNNPIGKRNGNVLAVLPFYASEKSQGANVQVKTSLSHRHAFLNLTVITLANVFPNIAVFVATQADYDYVIHESGLNRFLYDVHFASDLPKPEALPYGTSVKTKSLFQNKTYDLTQFEFVYYSESDQLPHLRNVDVLLKQASKESSLVIPHRLQPFPRLEDISNHTVFRKGGETTVNEWTSMRLHEVPDLTKSRCCFPIPPRKAEKISLKQNPEGLAFFRQYESFAYLAGTGNIHRGEYQACNLTESSAICRTKQT